MHCPAKKIFFIHKYFSRLDRMAKHSALFASSYKRYESPRFLARFLIEQSRFFLSIDFKSCPLIFPPPPQISNVSILELLRGWRRCWGIRSIRRTFSSNLLAHRVTPVCSIHRRQPWEIRCTNIWEKPEFIILLLFFFFFEKSEECVNGRRIIIRLWIEVWYYFRCDW